MSTAKEFVASCKKDLCKTKDRSSNGKKYHNKYTEYFAGKGGISKTGVMPTPYGYVPGHCTLFAMYHLCKTGNGKFVPQNALTSKKNGFFWHTGSMLKYYRKKGYVVTDPKKAKEGAIAFKGQIKNGKLTTSPTHTCVFIKTDGKYVWTVDGNVSDGKGHNNGAVHKRHKKYFLGFANLPFDSKDKPKTATKSSTTKVSKFPMKYCRITATPTSTKAHIKCCDDFPCDLAGKDAGRDYLYANGCNWKVLRKYTKASHAIWLRTTEKVKTPYGVGYLYMMCEHQDNSQMASVGHIYKNGEKMWKEGNNGNSGGYHLHVSYGFSNKKIDSIGSGWRKTKKGGWSMHIPGVKNIKIEQAVYIDKKFTKVIATKGIKFKGV